jgi:ParB family chromosome partitioning protein
MLPVADIIATSPRPQVEATTVQMLVESIKKVGLLSPIIVREGDTDFILVSGLHLLEAFRHLERDCIPAFILPASTTEMEARMAEIAENLHSAEPLERAEQINEWRELAKVRKVSAPLNHRPHDLGHRQTARDLGVDEKAVRGASKIASIAPEAKAAARNAGIDNNQSKLLKVAAAPAEQQVSAVHKIAGAKSTMAVHVEPAASLEVELAWTSHPNSLKSKRPIRRASRGCRPRRTRPSSNARVEIGSGWIRSDERGVQARLDSITV